MGIGLLLLMNMILTVYNSVFVYYVKRGNKTPIYNCKSLHSGHGFSLCNLGPAGLDGHPPVSAS